MSQTKCKINGDTWLVKVLSPKEMAKVVGQKGVAGYADWSTKTISLDQDCVSYELVAHEIHHAYYFYLHLEDTENIQLSDLREIFADLFATRGRRMDRQAKRIVKELKQEDK